MIILPSPIHANQMKRSLRIPEELITRFGDELSNVATVTVLDGRVEKMRLIYEANRVMIFDITSAEICFDLQYVGTEFC
ncbi:hypothetical protein JHK85_017534 [Glycine max]|nr:hypothetical protein JHK85_017534 [Glycine max]KAG5047749.1 hypothetical protein JHK86_017155 [Glycine max]